MKTVGYEIRANGRYSAEVEEDETLSTGGTTHTAKCATLTSSLRD
jgi:hypothetical protein